MNVLEIIDIQGTDDFEKRILSGAAEHTYIVDFWAPWCGPCQALAPALEAAVAPFSDQATLVKVNVDENQELAGRFGVQGIPAVKIFREGEIVQEFVGAQPETEVRRLIAEAIPSPADDLCEEGRRLAEAGRDEEAQTKWRAALEADPSHNTAKALLAGLLMNRGDFDEAETLAEGVASGSPLHETARNILARADFARQCREAGGRSAAAARLAEDDNDVEARYHLACCMAVEGDLAQALDTFLECVRRDRNWNDEAARRALLTMFDWLGPDDPLTEEYRRRLSRILFS